MSTNLRTLNIDMAVVTGDFDPSTFSSGNEEKSTLSLLGGRTLSVPTGNGSHPIDTIRLPLFLVSNKKTSNQLGRFIAT